MLTSATLTVDGSFEYVRGRLGIRRAQELRLASEFDYATQAILYLPKRMPDPRSREFAAAAAREVVEIVKRTRGRAFVLFTSYATLREVEAIASDEIEYPILVQGAAPRSVLLRDFKATPNAVLLATSSFWQGVDVVGEALSCVIIDKLPFASPGDPITAARIEAITARGGSAFGEYQIPLAVLALSRGSAGCCGTVRTAVCWPSSIRGFARWATAAGFSRRCRPRLSRTISPPSSGSSLLPRSASAEWLETSDRTARPRRSGRS